MIKMLKFNDVEQWQWYRTEQFGDVQIICVYDIDNIYVACQQNEPPQVISFNDIEHRVNVPVDIQIKQLYDDE